MLTVFKQCQWLLLLFPEPCTVTHEAMDEKNIAFQRPRENLRYSTHGDRFTFKCKEGKRKKTFNDDMIRYCIDGNITLPECV